MIKHIVMWKLFAEADGFSREENQKRVKQQLEKLPLKIKQIRSLEVGINFDQSAAAFDLVLCCEFNHRADLQVYQNHPEHEKFKQFIQNLRSDRVVVDYEI